MNTKRTLVLGNSITRHDPAPSIGWFYSRGMAASSDEKDYIHILRLGICERAPGSELVCDNVADFERNISGYNYDNFKAWRDYAPTLIIMRLIENVPVADVQEFGKALVKAVDAISGDTRPDVIFTGSFWKNYEGDKAISEAAKSRGFVYVSLRVAQGEEYEAKGLFKHTGVAAHPSDRGMAKIAELLLNKIYY